MDTQRMIFLDLEIYKEGAKFKTQNYFKLTDRNEYIPLDSCPHKSWLCNIPRGQFIRLRRNCSSTTDFLTQSQILADRFHQKGYHKDQIQNEIEKIGVLDRTSLFSDSNNKRVDTHEFKMVLHFNIQYKQFESIVNNHWDVLRKDKVLGTVLPPRPQFIYK